MCFLLLLTALLCAWGTVGSSTDPASSLVDLTAPDVIYENQNIAFNCSPSDDSLGVVSYSWFRDDIAIPSSFDDRLDMEVPLTWNGSCLTCSLEGENGTVANASRTLTVVVRSPTLLSGPTSQNLSEGQSLLLTCAFLGLPAPTISWFQNGEFLFSYLDSPSIRVDSVDGDDAGDYHCMGTNAMGMMVSPLAAVRVLFAPQLEVSPEDTTALAGSVAVLNCSARGDPPPTLSWLHNGEQLNTSGRVQVHSNGSLTIQSVRMEDMGIYQCVAVNSEGQQESDDAMLTIDVFPVFLVTPSSTAQTTLPNPVQLNCSAGGIPEPSYVWVRCVGNGNGQFCDNSVPVELDDRVTEDNGTLTFDPTTREDAGEYMCIALNIYGSIMSNKVRLTIIAPPLPPMSVNATMVGPSWVHVVWFTTAMPVLPITGYVLEYKLTFELNWMNMSVGTVPFHTISPLYPSARYQIRVYAMSIGGVSEASEVFEVDTLAGVPVEGLVDRAEQVTVDSRTPDTFLITWTIPQVLVMTSYLRTELRVFDLAGTMVGQPRLVDSRTNEVVSRLRPATNYTVSVTLVFQGEGLGNPVLVSAMTIEGIPDDPPTNIMTFALSHTSIGVVWAPPTTPNGVITNYTLYYSTRANFSANVTLGGVARSHNLTGLRPHTNYTVRLSASTLMGEGPRGPQEGVVVATEQDVPPAPSSVRVHALNSSAILVSWDPYMEGEVPGILTNFTIHLSTGATQLVFEARPEQRAAELANLDPFTQYTVGVAGATEAGVGNFSEPVVVRTLGDVPGAVVRGVMVEVVCPTSLRLRWTLPNTQLLAGPENETSYLLTSVSPTQTSSTTFSYSSTLSTYLLEDVVPFSLHTLRLALQNGNGTGPASDEVNVTSCDGPAPPPLNVAAEANSSQSVLVSWEAPPTVPGMLVGYMVRYSRQDQHQYSTVTTTSVELVLSGLEPFTVYRVGVATLTRGPVGNFSDDQLVRTIGDVPVAMVMNVSVQAACPSNLLVSWSPLTPVELRASPDNSSYEVFYSPRRTSVGSGSVASASPLDIPYTQLAAMTNISSLELNTEYSVQVRISNNYGSGPLSQAVVASTFSEGVPPAASHVMATPLNSSSLQVRWNMSSSSAPQPSYTVHYHPTATANPAHLEAWPQVSPSSPFTAVLEDLEVYTNYSVGVVARALCGNVSSLLVVAQTQQDISSPPLNITIVAVLPTRVKVQWSTPATPNGLITHYNVYCPGGVVTVSNGPDPLHYHECQSLQSDTDYMFAVSAVNGAGESQNVTASGRTACSPAPPTVELGQEGVVTISLTSSCPLSSVYLLVVVQVLVSYRDGRYDPPLRPVGNYTLQELLVATERYQEGEGRGRRQARPLNQEGVYIAANISEDDVGGFVLGDGNTYGDFTNHPLTSDLTYSLTLRGAVLGTDTPILSTLQEPFTVEGAEEPVTPTLFPLVPVVAGAGGFLLLAICMAAMISCVCCCCNRSLDKVDGVQGVRMERTSSFRLSKRKLGDPVEDFRANNHTEVLEDHPPVPVMGFINKLMVMKTNDNQLFLEEFGSIPMTIPHLNTDVANSANNKPKNRYNNILPYDATRVKLKGHGTDYINANYCSGYRKTKAYIATQGPLPGTIGDFWRMIWEENVRTIVMLTNTQEKGKIKCECYWPRDVGSSAVHGHLDVSLAAMTTLADYSIRTFALHKVGSSKEPREVIQFHFTSWPDHGVPQYATAMLSLLRRVRAHYGNSCAEEGPMLVHCSAGVGRTGTFIVIDTMLQRLTHEEEMVDIYGHVSLLRTQRNYMIQTEDQYFFVHEAVAEALLCGNTEVSLDSLPGYIESLCAVIPDDESETTNLELQFKRLALERHDPHRWMTANKDANKTKNRFVNVLPYDTSRVCLEYSPGVDGSDYINASHVDSYHTRRAFIATQGPLANTVQDYWRMLWQYQVPVVVMLTEEVEKGRECSARYWPGAILQPMDYGPVRVELNVERNSGTYTYRDLSVTNTTDNRTRLVRHFQFHGWPEVGVPSSTSLIEFIREVQKLCRSLATPHGPVVVHCSNGVGRTGVFLSLHIILERMLVEGLVDVFQTVKNLRIQRPAMVQTLEQYHLCYDAALTFLQSSEFMMPVPQPGLTRQRASSQRNSSHAGSRHGSHSSMGSHKKSKNSSPTRSPTRSLSQRNTPLRSESFKDSPKGTMELGASQGGGAQVYGGSNATSTFGSHSEGGPHATRTLSGSHSQLNGSHTQLSGSHTQLTAVRSAPGGTPTPTPAQMPAGNPPVTSYVPLSGEAYTQGSAGVHTPVMAPHNASSTPVPMVAAMASSQPPSHPPVMGSNTPVMSHTPVVSHAPLMASPAPSEPPVQMQRAAVATTAPSHIYHGYHGSLPDGKQDPQTQLMFNGTSSPLPPHAAGYTLSQTPSGVVGSQSPVYNGDGYGSQSQSSMFSDSSLLLPASTAVNSHLNNNSSGVMAQPSHLNNQQYHQLLEQKHAPVHPQFQPSSIGQESTPL